VHKLKREYNDSARTKIQVSSYLSRLSSLSAIKLLQLQTHPTNFWLQSSTGSLYFMQNFRSRPAYYYKMSKYFAGMKCCAFSLLANLFLNVAFVLLVCYVSNHDSKLFTLWSASRIVKTCY